MGSIKGNLTGLWQRQGLAFIKHSCKGGRVAHPPGKPCPLLQTAGSAAQPSLLTLLLTARLGLPSPPPADRRW